MRDEYGRPLDVSNAEVILESDAGSLLRTRLRASLRPGMNYRLAVPIDARLAAPLYKPTALRATDAFKLRVRIGNTTWLPIEMRADFSKLGQPAERTRLDLTLGEDVDGDGLPDAWERALIAALGGVMALADVKPGDDLDADGLSNLQEYLAGTSAFDAAHGLGLDLVDSDGSNATLEFLAIRGRVYAIEGSRDLADWSPLAFQLVAPESESPSWQAYYYARDTRVIRAQALPGAEFMRFFRVRVY